MFTYFLCLISQLFPNLRRGRERAIYWFPLPPQQERKGRLGDFVLFSYTPFLLLPSPLPNEQSSSKPTCPLENGLALWFYYDVCLECLSLSSLYCKILFILKILAQTSPPRWVLSGPQAKFAASLSQLLWLWAHISIMLSYSPNIRWPPICLPH